MTRTMQALLAAMAFPSLWRAIDYTTGNSYQLGREWGEELYLPMLWGAACAIIALGGFIAAFTRSYTIGINTSILGMAVYVMFAVTVFQTRMLPYPWPPEDVRLVSDHLASSAIWGILGLSLLFRRGVERKKSELLRGQ